MRLFTTASARFHAYDEARRRGLIAEAEITKGRLQDAADTLVEGYRALLDAGADREWLADQLSALDVELTARDHTENMTIDEAGERYTPIDLTQLHALQESLP